MKTIKSIDGKSLLIGGFLACTIFFAIGATGPTDKWDDQQQWETGTLYYQYGKFRLWPDKDGGKFPGAERYTNLNEWPAGWEPTAAVTKNGSTDLGVWYVRKRFK